MRSWQDSQSFKILFLSSRRINRQGFTLIEIVLSVGIFVLLFASVAVYYKKMEDVSENTTRYIQSGFLLEEGIEAVKLLRDKSWSANIAPLTAGTTYYLYWNGSEWKSTTTVQIIENMYTRSFVISDVLRDANDSISVSSGSTDPETKKVALTVSWTQKGGGLINNSLETYIMRLFNN